MSAWPFCSTCRNHMTRCMCRDPRDDVWAPYSTAGLHRGPDHTKHFHHRDREVPQK